MESLFQELSSYYSRPFVPILTPDARANFSRQLIRSVSLLFAWLVVGASIKDGQGVAKLKDLSEHVVGGEVEVDPRAENLAEPLVLEHSEPSVQPEHLPAKLDLLAGRLALLHPPQHVPEAAPLLLPVLLAPGLVGVCCQLPHLRKGSRMKSVELGKPNRLTATISPVRSSGSY